MGILSIMVKDANPAQRDVMIGQARRPAPRTQPAPSQLAHSPPL